MDRTDPCSLAEAMPGDDAASFLVHALGTGATSRAPTAERHVSSRGRRASAGSSTWTDAQGRTGHRQRALVHPRGLFDHAYWGSVSLLQAIVLGGMARNIAQAAARR